MHGYVLIDMSNCVVIPIPKGKQSNITDSANYCGIAVCSIFNKVF